MKVKNLNGFSEVSKRHTLSTSEKSHNVKDEILLLNGINPTKHMKKKIKENAIGNNNPKSTQNIDTLVKPVKRKDSDCQERVKTPHKHKSLSIHNETTRPMQIKDFVIKTENVAEEGSSKIRNSNSTSSNSSNKEYKVKQKVLKGDNNKTKPQNASDVHLSTAKEQEHSLNSNVKTVKKLDHAAQKKKKTLLRYRNFVDSDDEGDRQNRVLQTVNIKDACNKNETETLDGLPCKSVQSKEIVLHSHPKTVEKDNYHSKNLKKGDTHSQNRTYEGGLSVTHNKTVKSGDHHRQNKLFDVANSVSHNKTNSGQLLKIKELTAPCNDKSVTVKEEKVSKVHVNHDSKTNKIDLKMKAKGDVQDGGLKAKVKIANLNQKPITKEESEKSYNLGVHKHEKAVLNVEQVVSQNVKFEKKHKKSKLVYSKSINFLESPDKTIQGDKMLPKIENTTSAKIELNHGTTSEHISQYNADSKKEKLMKNQTVADGIINKKSHKFLDGISVKENNKILPMEFINSENRTDKFKTHSSSQEKSISDESFVHNNHPNHPMTNLKKPSSKCVDVSINIENIQQRKAEVHNQTDTQSKCYKIQNQTAVKKTLKDIMIETKINAEKVHKSFHNHIKATREQNMPHNKLHKVQQQDKKNNTVKEEKYLDKSSNNKPLRKPTFCENQIKSRKDHRKVDTYNNGMKEDKRSDNWNKMTTSDNTHSNIRTEKHSDNWNKMTNNSILSNVRTDSQSDKWMNVTSDGIHSNVRTDRKSLGISERVQTNDNSNRKGTEELKCEDLLIKKEKYEHHSSFKKEEIKSDTSSNVLKHVDHNIDQVSKIKVEDNIEKITQNIEALKNVMTEQPVTQKLHVQNIVKDGFDTIKNVTKVLLLPVKTLKTITN